MFRMKTMQEEESSVDIIRIIPQFLEIEKHFQLWLKKLYSKYVKSKSKIEYKETTYSLGTYIFSGKWVIRQFDSILTAGALYEIGPFIISLVQCHNLHC